MARQRIDLEEQTNWPDAEVDLGKLAQGGATPTQVLGWDGDTWGPTTVPGGTLPDNFSRAEVLEYTDDTHYVIGPLATPPVVSEVMLNLLGGLLQEIVVDFTVRQVTGGSAPGYYVCVSPSSSAPGGGTFIAGSNPSVGIVAQLTSGDKVMVAYATWPIP
jgi:hypothetical protein